MQYDFTGGQALPFDSMGFLSVYFVIVLVILLLQLRTRRVKPFGLIIMPLFILFLTLPVVFYELPRNPFGILLVVVGLIIGVAIGLLVGSMMDVKVDEKDGSMLLKGSIMAVLVWAVIIGLKIFGKDLLRGIGFIDGGLLTSAFLMMAVGTIIARRVFLYWRYLQMKKGRAIS